MKMGKKVREYKSGDFIFAKVKGYPAWPARVQKQNGKKYYVYFYGTGETANLPPNMIFDYAENKDKFLNKSVKRKDFNDGVRQIEHDFANNVPLEQVIGALAEAEPAPADDTMNDSGANDTADDSTIADTTVDETMDESANSAAINDGPVEDSDETGALVIDEGKQKGRKSAAKPAAAATPKAAKEPKTPRGRPKKDEPKDVEEEEKKEDEIVSRSGRKIRPKRYIDEQTEENTTLPSPAPKKRRGASPSGEKEKPEKSQDKNIRAYNTVQQSELRELKEPFKSADSEKENILIAYLPSGEYCGVKLFQSRPASFKNEASRLQWDKQAASNAITLKKQLEKGQITPQSISAQLVMDLNLTDEEKATLDKDRDLEQKKSRLHFLKTEMKLIELDAKIKTCLSLEKADTELCLKLIDELLELDLAALMLLKHPTCMETIKRMRVYVGNANSWEMSETEALTFSKQAHRIRNKADALFITMRDLFEMPDGLSFSEFFNERVAQFKACTENLHADKLLEMVHEPIEMSQPTSHTMKAAIDAANEEEATEPAADDTVQKKKTTPAKGKKANSTPAKTPVKRQSSRKQLQEEKEKEKESEKQTEETPELDTNTPNDTEKTDSEPKESNENKDTTEPSVEKPIENDVDEADKEVEKVNENSEKNDEKKPETKEKGDEAKSPKESESNSKENADKAEKSDNTLEVENDSEEKDDKVKDSKNAKESEKNSNSDKNSKKDKKDDKAKDDAKSSKDGKAKPGDKRKDKKDDKEKSEEKDKVDVDEPRAKRSRESKKTEPPPRSPAKRKSKS